MRRPAIASNNAYAALAENDDDDRVGGARAGGA